MSTTNIYGLKATVSEAVKNRLKRDMPIGKVILTFHFPDNKKVTSEIDSDFSNIADTIMGMSKENPNAIEVVAEIYNDKNYLVKTYSRKLQEKNGLDGIDENIPKVIAPANEKIFRLELGAISQKNDFERQIDRIEQAHTHERRDLEDKIRDEKLKCEKANEELVKWKRIASKYKKKSTDLANEIKDSKAMEGYTKIGTALAAIIGEKVGVISNNDSRSLLGAVMPSMPSAPQTPQAQVELSPPGTAIHDWLLNSTDLEQQMLFEILYPALMGEQENYVLKLHNFIREHNERSMKPKEDVNGADDTEIEDNDEDFTEQ